ncbi:MAG: FG-GAP-like repeat-containing protein [Candidatus Eisenbacteria bacterium]
MFPRTLGLIIPSSAVCSLASLAVTTSLATAAMPRDRRAEELPGFASLPALRAPLEVSTGRQPLGTIARGGDATLGSMQFNSIAQLDGMYNWTCAFGDTDQDGQREVIGVVQSGGQFYTRFFEEQGGNVYTDEQDLPYFSPYVAGDFDHDGLMEVLGQWSSYLRIYEASSVTGYPDHLAWQSPALINVLGYPWVGDSDHDGHTEIYQSWNPFTGLARFLIFENTGDNSYSLVFDRQTNSPVGREKAAIDLDQDGKDEIFVAADDGKVHVYEPIGLGWAEVAILLMPGFTPTSLKAGSDVNHDGILDLIVSGSSGVGWQTQLLQSNGNNSYEFVSSVSHDDGYFGLCFNAVIDVDGNGDKELVMSGGASLYVFEWSGGWHLSGQINDPDNGIHAAMFADDLNQNGRGEILWQVEASSESPFKSLLYETAGTVAVSDPLQLRASTLRAFPNPTRGDATLRWQAPSASPLILETFDSAGRRVALAGARGSSIAWDGSSLAAGIYWLRLVDREGRELGGTRVVRTR